MNAKAKVKLKVKFNPSIDHRSLKQYGLLGKPLKRAIKETKVGRTKIAVIKKSNLGVAPFQRDPDSERIKKLNARWHDDLGSIKVAKIKHGSNWYYSVIDGQQRACASPHDLLDCVITNTLAPVDNFLEANDSELVKPCSYDDRYWALVDRASTVDDYHTRNDTKDIVFMNELFKEYGFEPMKKNSKATDFGSNVSSIHNIYSRYAFKKIRKLLSYSDLELDRETQEFSRKVMRDVMEIMFRVFDRESFNAKQKYVQAWNGVFVFLSWLKWDYDVDFMIEKLKNTTYRPKYGRRESEKELSGIRDWKKVIDQDFGAVAFARDKWASLFSQLYHAN